MKPALISGVVAAAIVLFGLSISYGANAGPQQSLSQTVLVATATSSATGVDLPPTATQFPLTPQTLPTAVATLAPPPVPPQVVYVPGPPQTIVVQLQPSNGPSAPSITELNATMPPPPALPAPGCSSFYSRDLLNAWLSTHPDQFATFDPDRNGIACDGLVEPVAPTATLQPLATYTPFPTLAPASTYTPLPTLTALPTYTPVPTFTASPTPTATAVLVHGSVIVNFAGSSPAKPTVSKTFAVAPGSSASDAIKLSVGTGNIQSTDFGGNLGVFITGFYGVNYPSTGCKFWEFFTNGQSSMVGVSSFVVHEGDVLEFRTSTEFC